MILDCYQGENQPLSGVKKTILVTWVTVTPSDKREDFVYEQETYGTTIL
jgi:hypothetical protein